MGRARQTSVVVKVLIRFGHARIVKTLASVIRSAGGEALPAPPKIRVAELLDLGAVLASESRLSSANRMPVNAGYGVPVGRFLRSTADRRTLSTPACGREILFARAALPDPRAQTTDEAIVSWVPPPQLVEQVEREEREARLRSAAAREQAQGDTPGEHHALIHKLETEWKHALERLHRTRHAAQD